MLLLTFCQDHKIFRLDSKDNFISKTDKLLSKSLEGIFMKIKLFVGVLLIIAGLIMAIIGGMNLFFALGTCLGVKLKYLVLLSESYCLL